MAIAFGRVSPAPVSVIVPARDAAPTLPRLLAGLGSQTLEGAELILVDDGSSDATVALAEAASPAPRVLRAERRGPAAARNQGAAAAGAPVLAFVDADCAPTPAWLERGLAALEGADLVQGAVLPRPDRPVGPFDRSLWVTQRSSLFESANLLVRRDLFERLGGFESWLGQETGKELGEDVWFGWRARRAGARIAFCPDALVHHEVFARGPSAYAAERARLRFFPAMAARIPELRRELFYARWFLNQRSAAFDAAVAGVALAAATRRGLPLAAALPYLAVASKRPARSGRRAPEVALADMAADAIGLASLARGSVAARSLLL